MTRRIPGTAFRDVCGFNIAAWKRKSSKAMMTEWARRGASHPARTNVQGDIKHWLANYATYKTVAAQNKTTPTAQLKTTMRMYKRIAAQIETRLRAAQREC